jgi:amidase
VLPAASTAVVGIKPTVGLTSRIGVIPISATQDTVGPIARTVTDAAIILSVIAGPDSRDEAAKRIRGRSHVDYTRFLDRSGLKGSRIGVPRSPYFGTSALADALTEEALDIMRAQGAEVIDPAEIPTADALRPDGAERSLWLYEFKAGINGYLAARGPGARVRTLPELIAFNQAHAADELRYFGQELFELAETTGPLADPEYRRTVEVCRRLSRRDGIDAVMDRHSLDALVMPTAGPPWPINPVGPDPEDSVAPSPAAYAGYPLVTVPAGYADGLPIGVLFTGRPFSEPTLIRLAYAFEQATRFRRPPLFRALDASTEGEIS